MYVSCLIIVMLMFDLTMHATQSVQLSSPAQMNMVRPLCNVLMKVFFVTYYFVGMEHRIHFTHCSCEALSVTLARAELWPATPRNPCSCFTFGLLDWAEALMLESQVSLKDFCNTLAFRCPQQIPEVYHLQDVHLSPPMCNNQCVYEVCA